MRVRLLTSMAGPAVNLQYGDEADLTETTAKRLIERGMAEPVAVDTGDEKSPEDVSSAPGDGDSANPKEEPFALEGGDGFSEQGRSEQEDDAATTDDEPAPAQEETAVQPEVETASTRSAMTRGRQRKS